MYFIFYGSENSRSHFQNDCVRECIYGPGPTPCVRSGPRVVLRDSQRCHSIRFGLRDPSTEACPKVVSSYKTGYIQQIQLLAPARLAN